MVAEEVTMSYPPSAVERAMKVQEVILRALSGQLTWLQAAEILERSPRSIRRLRWRFEHWGYDGLFDPGSFTSLKFGATMLSSLSGGAVSVLAPPTRNVRGAPWDFWDRRSSRVCWRFF